MEKTMLRILINDFSQLRRQRLRNKKPPAMRVRGKNYTIEKTSFLDKIRVVQAQK